MRAWGLITVAVALILLFPLPPAAIGSQAAASLSPSPQILAHRHYDISGIGTHPPARPSPSAQPGSTTYDEQMGMTFTEGFTSMAYNVTAVEQSDPSSGTGPAYLLNGVSDAGYWYQVGLSWNWNPGQTPGTGFNMIFEVWDASGNSIYPASGGAGLDSFNGAVNQGDTVLLNLYFSSSYGVVMLVKDYSTGAQAFETYSSEGASQFLGQTTSTADSNGYFTGLMTEWYHPSAFYGNIAPVTYSNPQYALTSAWMWIDEFSCPDTTCATTTLLFSDANPAPVIYSPPGQLKEFASNGATMYSDAFRLITGPAYWSLTVSFTVAGGGTGYTAPTFVYVNNGASQSVSLVELPETYSVDAGSTWSVTGTLAGSSQAERWVLTGSQATGSADSSQTLNFQYQNEYQMTVTGGSGGADGAGWYASGVTATAISSGVFGRTGGSGQRVISYSVDGMPTQVTPTAGTVGTSVLMDAAHQVTFTAIRQFEVSVAGTCSNESLTASTVPGDSGWFDSGSAVDASCGHIWDEVPQQSRVVATGYQVNGGGTVPLPGPGNGSFIVTLTMDAPQKVTIDSETQFYATFNFTDASGARTIVPAELQLTVDDQVLTVNGSSLWLKSGANLSVSKLVYEGLDVKPINQTHYSISGPATITLKGLVFDAKVRVTDIFGLPVSGAEVSLSLANGTTIEGSTSGDGTLTVPNIPLGNFTGRVTGVGSTASFSGNAAEQVLTRASVLFSTTTLALLFATAAALVGLAVYLARRRIAEGPGPSPS